MADEVLTEQVGQVLVVTLNRPDVKNALDAATVAGLVAALADLDTSPSCRAGVITGRGGTFCAGMDLKAYARDGRPPGTRSLFRRERSKPLVGAIEGFALGGGLEVALLCDVLVAAEDAVLGAPEVRVGLFAAGGGLLRLPRRLPPAVAMQMALTGLPITAGEGQRFGLVSSVVDRGSALTAALEVASSIAANSPAAVAASMQLIRASIDGPEESFWALQESLLDDVVEGKDALEGTSAFLEKRAPRWSADAEGIARTTDGHESAHQ